MSTSVFGMIVLLMTADRRRLTAHPMLPVAPHKPNHCGHDDHSNHRIQPMEVLAHLAPVLAELHPEICQAQAPWPRAKKCIEMESAARHARDSGGQRDECADHWQQASNEHCKVSPTSEESVCPI